MEKAEEDFREAMARARAMGAKLYELRAAVSLARLMAARGERDAAREMLRPIKKELVGKSVDVDEAGTLLRELGG